jgi:hypothetical protein
MVQLKPQQSSSVPFSGTCSALSAAESAYELAQVGLLRTATM